MLLVELFFCEIGFPQIEMVKFSFMFPNVIDKNTEVFTIIKKNLITV